MENQLPSFLKTFLKITLIFTVSLSLKAKTVILNDNNSTYKIGKYLSILEDKKGTLTFDDIFKKKSYSKVFYSQ